MFQSKTYIGRRKILKEKTGPGIILFLGNDESPMNYADNTYHFRQDSTFLYYFGIQHPGLAAVIDIDEDREILFATITPSTILFGWGHSPPFRNALRLAAWKRRFRRKT